MNTLINVNKPLSQHEIETKTKMNKVKVHRTLKKLKEKNVIIYESKGKTNRIFIPSNLKELFG